MERKYIGFYLLLIFMYQTNYITRMYTRVCAPSFIISLLLAVFCLARPVQLYANDQDEVKHSVVDESKESGVEHNQDTESGDSNWSANATDETAEQINPEEKVQELTFNVWEYRVEGNSLLERGQIERSVYPFLGPDKTIVTIEAARTSLETAFRDNGFGTVFVDIPEQDVDGGVVTLNVTEGKVERLRVSGSRYYSLGKIKEQVPALAEGNTPYLPDVQKQLTALNKGVTGRTITPVMKPGKTPGKIEVELKVKDEFPLHGSLEINDRYSKDTNRLRLNANISYDNLWQKNHSASVGYVVAPQDRNEVEVVFGTYLVRFPGSDNLIALYAVDSSSNVATTGDINQIGAGNTFGARAIFPLPSLNSYTHSLTLGSDYKDFDETTLLGSDSFSTPVSYLSFVTSYTGNWFHEQARSSLNLEISFAPSGLGNTFKEFNSKRVGSKPNFSIFKGNFTHERKIIFNSFLNTRIGWQLTDAPLISNEQISAGGIDTVRGYLESQQLADDGLIGSIEIHSPSVAKYIADFFNDIHFYAFADAAKLNILEPLADQVDAFTLGSIGLGLDVTAFDGINADLLWAYILSENDNVRSGDNRFHFNLGYNF